MLDNSHYTTIIAIESPMAHRCLFSALLGAFVLLLACTAASAAEDAFSVRVPVESQQSEVREQALTQAIAQVLIRMTGRDDIAQAAAAAPLLERPAQFLQRYQYESQPGQQLVLLMQFDGPALRRALAERGVPSWGPERPPVLVWLAVEQAGARLLVGGEEGGEIRAKLQEAAAKRGLLLLFPLMDSEDRERVGYADVFGGFTERVKAAADRYGAPIMAMARTYRDGARWVSRWTLSGAVESTWSSAGESVEQALETAAAEMARGLAPRYAVLPSADAADQRLVLRVIGVSSLRDYDRLERRLRSIGGVDDVRPLSLESDAVVLQLALQMVPERILRSLANDRNLVPVGALQPGVDAEQQAFHEPTFRLTP